MNERERKRRRKKQRNAMASLPPPLALFLRFLRRREAAAERRRAARDSRISIIALLLVRFVFLVVAEKLACPLSLARRFAGLEAATTSEWRCRQLVDMIQCSCYKNKACGTRCGLMWQELEPLEHVRSRALVGNARHQPSLSLSLDWLASLNH